MCLKIFKKMFKIFCSNLEYLSLCNAKNMYKSNLLYLGFAESTVLVQFHSVFTSLTLEKDLSTSIMTDRIVLVSFFLQCLVLMFAMK